MKHDTTLARYPGSLDELAAELGDLRYDALAGFLRTLARKIQVDGTQDAARGRPRLAAALQRCAADLEGAASDMDEVWAICAPFMGAEPEGAGPEDR